jgi:hypothetical protein
MLDVFVMSLRRGDSVSRFPHSGALRATLPAASGVVARDCGYGLKAERRQIRISRLGQREGLAMSTDNPSNPQTGTSERAKIERREALIKLGKYAAYATPVVLASISSAHAQVAPGDPPPPSPPPSHHS